jgi:hypothetical protein
VILNRFQIFGRLASGLRERMGYAVAEFSGKSESISVSFCVPGTPAKPEFTPESSPT